MTQHIFRIYNSTHGRLAQLARASRLHRGGQGFESLSVHINVSHMDNFFYLYILYSTEIDRYYVGQTSDIIFRRQIHNSGTGLFSKFTKRAKDWEIAYTEVYPNRSLAKKRETEIIKMKSRKYIEKLVSAKN